MKVSAFLRQFRGAPATILWDFQNLPVKRGTIKPTVEAIKKPLEPICRIRAINAYLQASGKFNLSGLPAEFRSAGVEPIKCPFSEREGCTTDTRMIQTVESLGREAPADERLVFVFMSRDGDFAACAKTVRSAGHAVVLVLGPNATCSKRLLQQADLVLVGKSYQLQGVRLREEKKAD